ncbi:hypothetical protein CCH79_00003950 [Xyrichtys novacula]|uniref:Chemokine interleukin-8-like domain-containing protein n=1 Tax=Xyrichtys novacula TaxID=13765 RepID=A0AAV1H6V6_XYRNO|nr:hypothetical protein CCH79_00003950 [Xyrichtys novacula]
MSVRILTIFAFLFPVFTWSSVQKFYLPDVGPSCCYEGGPYIPFKIIKCIHQTRMRDCRTKNYAVQVEGGEWKCIDSESKWMKQQIQKGIINCTEGRKYN